MNLYDDYKNNAYPYPHGEDSGIRPEVAKELIKEDPLWADLDEIAKSKIKTISFEVELSHLINRFSLENGSNTPDYALAQYLREQLDLYNKMYKWRSEGWGDPSYFTQPNRPVKDFDINDIM